jgi:methylase of polypeptide subunit release factors
MSVVGARGSLWALSDKATARESRFVAAVPMSPTELPIDSPEAPDADPQAQRSAQAQQRFWQRLADGLAQQRVEKLVLARPAGVQPDDLLRVVARPLQLRGQACLSLVYSHRTRDITQNLPVAEALALLPTLTGQPGFRNAHLLTRSEESQLVFSKRGKALLSTATRSDAPASGRARGDAAVASDTTEPAAPAGHDREKQRWIDSRQPFLIALGVTTAQHQLVPAMARKWKQINKFVEVFAHALQGSRLADAKVVRVADFGAGRGYLTFAVHDWLRHAHGVDAQVTGVELRPDLVAEAQATIAQLGLTGLKFEAGDVRTFAPGAMNVMIALHACDTATDHAIHLGLKAGADIILCSPCCHKQIRPQLLSPHPLRPVFQHGIHAEQQAEMLTDSLRALLLEASGYDTQVFEFIALEHTRKNKMILAVKRKNVRPADAALAQVAELKRYFGIREQALETLLLADAPA